MATGKHCHNRVMFKQVLQAAADDFPQLDAARIAGVNENLATLPPAKQSGVPGGPALCEPVCHLSVFDYTSVSASMEDRFIEYVDHLHERFVEPSAIENGRPRAPRAPGFSTQTHRESLRHSYPNRPEWSKDR
jgi:L-fuconate dehydratase